MVIVIGCLFLRYSYASSTCLDFAFLSFQAAATVKDGKRILFRFDRAAFSFKILPFKVPYPVPFRLLGDEAKGWLDTTYLSTSGIIRISRGNKVFMQYIFIMVCIIEINISSFSID